MDNPVLTQNKHSWDAMADTWFGSTSLPTYGCLMPTEDELRLFPDLQGKRVLDIGCGSGHSLHWCAQRGAAELCGLDLSSRQIETAQQFLCKNGYEPKLYNAPMETDCGLPRDYFDVVYSIYAVGWTVDLPATFRRIASYLKAGGVFLFSWDHPLMRCVEAQEDQIMLTGCYHEEDVFSYMQRGYPVTLTNRKLSTYINALAEAGLLVERLVEETDAQTLSRPAEFSSGYYAPYKAKMLPLSFILKARKVGGL